MSIRSRYIKFTMHKCTDAMVVRLLRRAVMIAGGKVPVVYMPNPNWAGYKHRSVS
jgi:hypothetical protein